VVEALAHAGAFDALSGANRRTHLYAAITTEAAREGDQLALGLWNPVMTAGEGGEWVGAGPEGALRDRRSRSATATGSGGAPIADVATPPRPGPAEWRPRTPTFTFSDYTDAEVVRAELEVLGLDATRHIVSFFEPLLADLGVTRAKDLHRRRQDERVMVAGVKIASQTPAIRSGQRIIFLSLDDATGPIEVTVFESVQPKVARTVFHAYAMAVWGQLRRTGVKGVSVVAEEIWDLTALHVARRQGRLREAMGEPTEPRAPAKRLWHASGGSAG
jgi:error-prone DNA polymerase